MRVQPVRAELTIPRDHTRSQGVHLSDVIRDIAFRLGKLDKKWEHEEMNPVVIRMGMAWEVELAHEYPDVIFHPGEGVVDGIYMTPDGYELIDGDYSFTGINARCWRVHEFKYTRKSSRDFYRRLERDDPKLWMYVTQTKAYCRGINSRTGWLHVAFANGDYSPNAQPEYKVAAMTFSKKEIRDNWEMIVEHSRDMRREGRIR